MFFNNADSKRQIRIIQPYIVIFIFLHLLQETIFRLCEIYARQIIHAFCLQYSFM